LMRSINLRAGLAAIPLFEIRKELAGPLEF
jgi:hypothetical protein